MNESLSLIGCFQQLALYFVAVALVTGVGWLLEKRINHAGWRRSCWQGVGVALLVVILLIFIDPLSWITHSVRNEGMNSASKQNMIPALSQPPISLEAQHFKIKSDKATETRDIKTGFDSPIMPESSDDLASANAATEYESQADTSATQEKLADQYLSGNAPLWIGILWITGFLVVGFRTVMAHGLLWILSLRYREIDDVSLLRRAENLACRLGLKTKVRLLAAPFGSPITFGIKRPTIVVPRHFTHRYTAEQQEAILSHELGHLAAKDPTWLMLLDIVVAVWWWHPLAWQARRRYHAAAEFAADDASAMVEDGPSILAECLVALGTEKAAAPIPVWLSMAGSSFRSDLGLRVERLLGSEHCAYPRQMVPGKTHSTKTAMLALVVVANFSVISPNLFQKGENMNIFSHTWKHAFAAFTLITALEGDITPVAHGKQQIALVPATNDNAAVVSETNTNSNANSNSTAAFTNRYGSMSSEMIRRYGLAPQMSPELMRRYGLVPPGDTNAQTTNRYQGMSPELMRRYGLTPQQVDAAGTNSPITNRYQGMSPELMRRYGLVPPRDTNAQTTDRYQGMSPELMRRYGLTPRQNKSEGTNSSASDVIVNSIGMKLKLVQPGTLQRRVSVAKSAEKPNEYVKITNVVEITKPFYLGIYEVTQREWTEIMGTEPSEFKGKDLPVDSVSWHEAQEFLKRLSNKEKKTYRLPIEEEWEYACRAGTATDYCFGDDVNLLEEYGWFDKNSGDRTHPVGTKKSNAWGFYDMHGNVLEWCADWKNVYHKTKDFQPNTKEPSSGSVFGTRGGGWAFKAMDCRSNFHVFGMDRHYENQGFRVVLEPSQP